MTFSIQQVPPTDYNILIDIWEQSVRATHDFLKEEDLLFYRPLILNEYFNAVRLVALREGDTITGFAGVADQNLEMLFIHPSFFGKGLGKALLSYCIEKLEVEKVDVNEQNEQAVGFYLHMGFEVTDRSALDSMGKPYPVLHMLLKKRVIS